MANSSIITKMKRNVISEIINDETFFYAINSPDYTDPNYADDLIGTHIFGYHQNPNTLNKTITFLTIQVHIPKTYDTNKIWVLPQLEIWVISHEKCMVVDNIPKITDNRNDYISKLLDLKFNGRDSIGTSMNSQDNLNLYGKLDLISNVEGAYSTDYLYRQLIFEAKDLNNSLCEY